MSNDPLQSIGKRWNAARQRERQLAANLYAAIQAAHAAGMPETQIAATAGVDRMTVRRALGKR